MKLNYSSYSVTVPDPNFGDVRRFTSNGIRRVMPNGKIKIYRNDDWPVIETFIYDIYRLTQQERDDFISLLNASNGQKINIIDHLNASRGGYIVTPVNEILTMRDGCWYDVHFEFMVDQIVNIYGDCHDNYIVRAPVEGDLDYHKTIGDDSYFIILAENGVRMLAEDGDYLYIEAY